MEQTVVYPVPLHACVGRHIRQYRQSKGLSQRDLADMIGKSHQYLSFVERGTCDMKLSTLELLSKALDMPVSAFVANEDVTALSLPAAI